MQINFRSCSGIPARYGQRVAADRLYRSGHLADHHGEGVGCLLGFDFDVIVDLRYPGERLSRPSPWPSHYAERLLAHDGERAAVAPHLALMESGQYDETELRNFYLNYYAKLPFDKFYQPLFAKFLCRMPNADGRALVHCTAGKDRTGILIALILYALGVNKDAIMANYMESRNAPGMCTLAGPLIDRLSTRLGVGGAQRLIGKYLDVDEDYLSATFSAIEDRAGSFEAYYDGAGLNAERRDLLRRNWLEG